MTSEAICCTFGQTSPAILRHPPCPPPDVPYIAFWKHARANHLNTTEIDTIAEVCGIVRKPVIDETTLKASFCNETCVLVVIVIASFLVLMTLCAIIYMIVYRRKQKSLKNGKSGSVTSDSPSQSFAQENPVFEPEPDYDKEEDLLETDKPKDYGTGETYDRTYRNGKACYNNPNFSEISNIDIYKGPDIGQGSTKGHSYSHISRKVDHENGGGPPHNNRHFVHENNPGVEHSSCLSQSFEAVHL